MNIRTHMHTHATVTVDQYTTRRLPTLGVLCNAQINDNASDFDIFVADLKVCASLVFRLVDWLVVWLVVWLIGWLIVWLVD